MTKYEIVEQFVNNLDDCQVVSLWNSYCDRYNCCDDMLYSNDEYTFDDLFSGNTPSQMRDLMCGASEYSMNDDWFGFDGYARLVSYSDPKDAMDINSLVDSILDDTQILTDAGDDIYNDFEEEMESSFCEFATDNGLGQDEIDEIDFSDIIDEDWTDLVNDKIAETVFEKD